MPGLYDACSDLVLHGCDQQESLVDRDSRDEAGEGGSSPGFMLISVCRLISTAINGSASELCWTWSGELALDQMSSASC